MSKPKLAQTFRSPRWVVAFLIVTTFMLAVTSIYFYRTEGISLEFAAASAFTFLVLLGLADSISTQVAICAGRLIVRSNFRTRQFSRAELEKVTWEHGCGVSLQLRSGIWFKLPDVGNSQAVANSIRGWLKRADDSSCT